MLISQSTECSASERLPIPTLLAPRFYSLMSVSGTVIRRLAFCSQAHTAFAGAHRL